MKSEHESYLQYLPPVLWQTSGEQSGFLRDFLHIFEDMFASLEEEVDDIPKLFNPWRTPQSFLPWLASWVVLELDEKRDWDEKAKRQLLKHIVSLYKKRGTKAGLAEYLRNFVENAEVSIEDKFFQGMVVGEIGTIGSDTFVGGSLPPHFFIVTIMFPKIDRIGFLGDTVQAIRSILDLEKPAHTYYALRFEFPVIEVGERSTVSEDTIIGATYPVFV